MEVGPYCKIYGTYNIIHVELFKKMQLFVRDCLFKFSVNFLSTQQKVIQHIPLLSLFYCAVPENIHTHPKEGHGKFRGGGKYEA